MGKRQVLTIIVLAVATGTVPGTAGASTHHPKPISKSAAGKQYLALVAPVNAALATFVNKAHHWTDSTSDATAEGNAQPAIAALKHLNSRLLSDQWPANTQHDVRGLITADAPVIGDLQGLAAINLLNASSWLSTFDRDLSQLSAAVGFIRHDLGLPPAKN